MNDDDDDQCSVTIVCSGIPYCELTTEQAREAMENNGGCIWCARIYTEVDGREFVVQPGTA